MKTEKSTIGKIHEILAIFVTFVTSFIILELTHHRFFHFCMILWIMSVISIIFCDFLTYAIFVRFCGLPTKITGIFPSEISLNNSSSFPRQLIEIE